MEDLKLKILDHYIIKKFLGTFFYSITLIMVICVVFDISEKMDDFIENDAPLKAVVFDYYFNFIPYFAVLFSSLFTFIAVIFFTSKMAAQTEFIAILSNGVSFKRILWPYFLSALLISVLTYYLYDFVIPNANKHRFAFEERYIHNAPVNFNYRNLHRQLEPGIYAYMESFNNYSNTGYRFSLEKFDSGQHLVSKLLGEYIRWDSTKSKWNIQNYYIRDIKGFHETITRGNSIDTTLKLTPTDFRRRQNAVEAMDYFELRDFIADQKMQGAENFEYLLVEKYKRVSVPFSTFILTLIGVALSSRKTRGGMGMHIGLGVALSFSYILFMQFSSQFAIGGSLPPLLAVWIPNILYAGIAYYLYRTAPK
jgi:lipopolysaccharide export system permease protein